MFFIFKFIFYGFTPIYTFTFTLIFGSYHLIYK
jgi:hypothetical protein